MDGAHFSSRNPWTDDDRSLGRIKDVIFLCEKSQHIDQDRDSSERLAAQAHGNSPSLKMISQLREIEKLRNEKDKVHLDIQRRLQDKETQDLTHTNILENRAQKINQLNSHLQSVANQKDKLIGRLQQPYVGDFIKLDVHYKEYASEIFTDIVPVLSALSSQLENIEWTSKTKYDDGRLDHILSEISSTLASLELKYQTLSQVADTTRAYHDVHSPNTSLAPSDGSYRPKNYQ